MAHTKNPKRDAKFRAKIASHSNRYSAACLGAAHTHTNTQTRRRTHITNVAKHDNKYELAILNRVGDADAHADSDAGRRREAANDEAEAQRQQTQLGSLITHCIFLPKSKRERENDAVGERRMQAELKPKPTSKL